jgi:hypothetical protein
MSVRQNRSPSRFSDNSNSTRSCTGAGAKSPINIAVQKLPQAVAIEPQAPPGTYAAEGGKLGNIVLYSPPWQGNRQLAG